MTPIQLQRLLNFVRRTGDTGIVCDAGSDGLYALVPLDRYEALLAGGRADQALSAGNSSSLLDDFDEATEGEAPVSNEPYPLPAVPASPAAPAASAAASLPPESEDLSDIPHEAEEEKFYLEPVE
ncbi:MAG: hypothetical protein HYV42_00745 [Candidatus Magasanikbacteria bacterium]|nr:hypothetical protein [Candidatus Magasanikbacteria bacterium]